MFYLNVNNYQKEYIPYLLKQDSIKFLFVIIALISIGSAYISREHAFLESFYLTLSNAWLFCITGILTGLVISLNVGHNFEGQEAFGLRFLDRKQVLKEQVKIVFKINAIFFLFMLCMTFIGVNILSKGYISVEGANLYLPTYSVPSGIYLCFFLFRMFILSELLAMINVIFSKIISGKMIYILNLCMIGFYVKTSITPNIISSITQIKFLPTEYILLLAYKSFPFEILCSFIYIMMLFLLFFVSYQFILKKGYDIGK